MLSSPVKYIGPKSIENVQVPSPCLIYSLRYGKQQQDLPLGLLLYACLPVLHDSAGSDTRSAIAVHSS